MASISILVHGIYVDAVTWTAMRFMTGLSYAGLYVVAESWLNDRASNETRGQVLSVYMVITTLGLGGGQFLLNLSDPLGVELFVLVSVIVSFGLIPILLTARPAPRFESSGTISLKELYKASPLAVISNGLTGAAHGTFFGLGAVYAAQELQGVEQVSMFMASFLLGSLIFQWPIGWLADQINRRVIMTGLCILAIVSCVMALSVEKGSTLYFAIVVILGGAAMPMYSLTVAYANDRLEPEQIVAASGSLVMVAGIGLSVGPIMVSYLMGEFGNSFFFVGIASAFAMILGFTAYRMNVTEAVAADDQRPFMAVGVIGTPVAQYNAPDAEEYVEALINDELARLDEDNESDLDEGELDKYLY
jgi:MFS family permease